MADEGQPRCGFYADAESGVCYRNLDFMGFPGYRVGDDGSVWSCKEREGRGWRISPGNWHQLKPRTNREGHLLVKLTDRQPRLVHRFVLFAFVGPCPEGMECCHGEGGPANNNLTNLRWDTDAANIADTIRLGRYGRVTKEEQVRAIRDDHAKGVAPLKLLALKHGVSQKVASQIVRRRTWKNVA